MHTFPQRDLSLGYFDAYNEKGKNAPQHFQHGSNFEKFGFSNFSIVNRLWILAIPAAFENIAAAVAAGAAAAAWLLGCGLGIIWC